MKQSLCTIVIAFLLLGLLMLGISCTGAKPSISYSPASLSFTAVQGGDNPAIQALGIWNSGGGTLEWSVSDDAAWLNLSPMNGSSIGGTSNVIVSVNISTLVPGDYTAVVTLSAPATPNSPQTVPIMLTVASLPTPTPTPTPIPTATATIAPTPTSIQLTPKPSLTPVHIIYLPLGEWAASPPWRIIISSVETSKSYNSSSLIEAPPGAYFVIATVSVTNGGISPLSINAGAFIVIDKSGFYYAAVQPLGQFYNAFPWFMKTVAPGQTVGGRIIFVVPDDATELSIITEINGKLVGWVIS